MANSAWKATFRETRHRAARYNPLGLVDAFHGGPTTTLIETVSALPARSPAAIEGALP
jgi:hypothetical protein